ncbi:MAG: S8 family serine peptidase, partial [Planctomycetota bacterium]
MQTRTSISLVVVAVLVSVVAGAASAEYLPWQDIDDANEPNYVEGELLVRFAPKLDATIPTKLERRAVLTALGGARESGSYLLVPGLTVVKLPDGVTVEQALRPFNASRDILYAEPNWILRALLTPDDPNFGDQWGLNNTGQTGGTFGADVNAPEAWNLAMGTQEIVVAVIDTGIDYNHPDLAANMWVNEGEIPGNDIDDDGNGFIDDVYGYNMIGVDPNEDPGGTPVPDPNHDGNPMDDCYHGTHCAGIIGAVTNNGVGVAGVCPNVQIMALKYLGTDGKGEITGAISCIQYALNNGANIMSNSWMGPDSTALKNAIEAAADAGLLCIAAAGNSHADNDTDPLYPASYDCNNIVAVSATDHNDHLAWFSNYGQTSVDLGAPGSSILSTFSTSPYVSGKYVVTSGTSMACPHVAGACALVWSVNP